MLGDHYDTKTLGPRLCPGHCVQAGVQPSQIAVIEQGAWHQRGAEHCS